MLCSYTLQCCAVVVGQCEGSNRLGNMKGQLTIFVTVKLQSARVCTRVCTECVLGLTVCVCVEGDAPIIESWLTIKDS